ncbi:ABC transporter ATP-binding protein [bacterium]|jgi:ABC-2 type transport system ATP-binding protein|nr:ABC transporter ATP-binding protein [bacterium]
MSRIILDNVSKSFNLGFKNRKTGLERVFGFFLKKKNQAKKKQAKKIEVIKNISLSIKSGEKFGIIGKNGCGKSTLLRIIAGIYAPNSGTLKVNGSVFFLSRFNNGIKPKLTMRENIYLSACLLGLEKKNIKEIFPLVVSFSGLKDFLDTRVLYFSSGMVSRLAFSITMLCVKYNNPEILLLDEIFSAGADEEFRAKGLNLVEDFIKGGITVVFVSHSKNLVRKYCDRVAWIDKGRMIQQGDPAVVVNAYVSSLNIK